MNDGLLGEVHIFYVKVLSGTIWRGTESGLLPVEALLVEKGEGGDHEGDGAGDDEDPAHGAHPTCQLTHTWLRDGERMRDNGQMFFNR